MTAGLYATLLSTDRGFSHRVHVMDGAGSGLRRLTDRRASGRPDFSPDGTRVVFPGPLTDDSEGRYCLYVVGVDGAGLRRLTTPRIADADPAWSPDGATIAFVRDPEGAMNPSRWRLLTMPAGGGAQAQLVDVAGAREPAWSPDGRQIAFVAFGVLYVMNRDTTALRAIVQSGARSPAWAPDGRTIAYVDRMSAERSRIATVPATGGPVTYVADFGNQTEDPSWGADSSTLHFLAYSGQGWEGRRDTLLWRTTATGDSPQLVARFATQAVRLALHPDPPPGPVTALTATEVDQRTALLRWTNPGDLDFTVAEVWMTVGTTPPQRPGDGVRVYAGRTPEALVTGLEPAKQYSFSVFARDRGGNAATPATITVTTPPPGVPDPPQHVEAVPGARSARVSWTPPLNDGGRPLVGYTVTDPAHSQSVDVAAGVTSVVLSSLSAGETHVFTVVARNELGPSAPALSDQVVPDTGAVAGTYTAMTPQRLVDTRTTRARVAPGADLVVPVAGVGAVPAQGAAAAVLTVVATQPTGSGFLASYPAGGERPVVSTLNYVARQTVANLDVVRLAGGAVAIGAGAAPTHVIADVAGWYADASGRPGGRLNALAPARILDTRSAGSAAIRPTGTHLLAVTGVGGVPPTGVGSVVLVLTAVSPTAETHLTVHPAGEARPTASVLNAARGETIAVLVIARVSPDGRIAIYNHAGSTHVLADVLGYHTARAEDPGELYTPMPSPRRVLDSRIGVGGPARAVGPEGVVTLTLHGTGGIPSTARTVLLNVTATGASQATHVTVYPGDRRPPPTSVLNVGRGRTVADLVLAKLSRDGRVSLRNAAGTVHLIADVRGYYTA